MGKKEKDFDLLVELIAHALVDEETGTIQVAHHQSVARHKCKLVADFGIQMHLAWTQHLLDNRDPMFHPTHVGSANLPQRSESSRRAEK